MPAVVIVASVGDGEEAEIVKLARTHPASTIIALAEDPRDEATILVLAQLGVHACLPIVAPAEDIVAAVPCICAGGRMLSPIGACGPQPRRPADPRPLTKREHEVYDLLRKGMTNPEIAASLFVTTHTVHTHVQRILSKLGVRSRHLLVDAQLGIPGAAVPRPLRDC